MVNHKKPSACKVINKNYKGYRIEKCGGLIEVVKGTSRIIIALDDSKLSGSRKFVKKSNNITSAKKYIDWTTRSRK